MIFLIDTPEDIKDGYSYVVNRDEDKYTILEGDIKLFDKIAFDLRNRGVTSSPYDRVVLSFEEEDLTLEEIQEIYYEWKEMYLGNYDEDEYCLFSVIHWDDDHPHVHVGIINRSMVNEKHLRMTRYGVDNTIKGRNHAIQEIVNYKHGLKSPHSEKYFYQTTREQKKRDWEVGKGKVFYEVEDDKIYEIMRMATSYSDDFDDFVRKIESELRTAGILDSDERIKIGDSYYEEVIVNIGKKRFKSLIFNEDFYNSHIEEIKNGEDRFKVDSIRLGESEYLNMFEEKDFGHNSELNRRKIHHGLLEHKINKGELNFLRDSLDIDREFERIREIKGLDFSSDNDRELIDRYVRDMGEYIFCVEDLTLILQYCGFELKSSGGDYVSISRGEGDDLYIHSEKLCDAATVSRGDEKYNEKISAFQKTKIRDLIDKLPLNKRGNLEIIKAHILNEIYEKGISNRKSLDLFLDEIGIKKVNDGRHKNKGGYITLDINGKKSAIYDELLYGYYNGKNMDDYIDNEYELSNSSLTSTLMDIEDGAVMKPESVNEYKLKYSDDFGFIMIDGDANMNDLRIAKRIERDRKARTIVYDRGSEVELKRSLSEVDSHKAMLKILDEKKWNKLKLSGKNLGYQKSLVSSLTYLSKERDESRSWIDQLMIEADFNDNILNINRGEVFELIEEPVDLSDMMSDDFITIGDFGDKVSTFGNYDKIKDNIKNDFKEKKIDLSGGKKIKVNKISLSL